MRSLLLSPHITRRDESENLGKYLHDIAKYPKLSEEEEVELSRRIKAGDEEALEKLVSSNLRFVVSVAKQYQGQGIALPDLINEGNLGLFRAAQRFDDTRGFKFITFAVWWIRHYIANAIAAQSRIVTIPTNKYNNMLKVYQTAVQLEQELQREPTTMEIAERADLTEQKVLIALAHQPRHLSLDTILTTEEDGPTLKSTIPANDNDAPDQSITDEFLYNEVLRAIDTLPAKEADILKQLYGLDNGAPKTIIEITRAYNITAKQLNDYKKRIFKRLRKKQTFRSLYAQLKNNINKKY